LDISSFLLQNADVNKHCDLIHNLNSCTMNLGQQCSRNIALGDIMDIIKVSGTSRTSAVAGAIAGVFRDNKRAEIQAIGAGAVNQAVKAMILAKGYLNEDGYDVVFFPEFVDVEIDEKIRTAVKMTVDLRYPESEEESESSESDDSIEESEPVIEAEENVEDPFLD
jgi:stage V sporulation protein S